MTTTNDWMKLTPETIWSSGFFDTHSVEVVTPSGHLRTMLYEHPCTAWIKERAEANCWCRVCDIPAPPKGQTQRERDMAAFKEFCEDTEAAQHSGECSPSWHAALAWERAETAKLMDEYWSESSRSYDESAFQKLRARLRP